MVATNSLSLPYIEGTGHTPRPLYSQHTQDSWLVRAVQELSISG